MITFKATFKYANISVTIVTQRMDNKRQHVYWRHFSFNSVYIVGRFVYIFIIE